MITKFINSLSKVFIYFTATKKEQSTQVVILFANSQQKSTANSPIAAIIHRKTTTVYIGILYYTIYLLTDKIKMINILFHTAHPDCPLVRLPVRLLLVQ